MNEITTRQNIEVEFWLKVVNISPTEHDSVFVLMKQKFVLQQKCSWTSAETKEEIVLKLNESETAKPGYIHSSANIFRLYNNMKYTVYKIKHIIVCGSDIRCLKKAFCKAPCMLTINII